jgi:hypothetical protein
MDMPGTLASASSRGMSKAACVGVGEASTEIALVGAASAPAAMTPLATIQSRRLTLDGPSSILRPRIGVSSRRLSRSLTRYGTDWLERPSRFSHTNQPAG